MASMEWVHGRPRARASRIAILPGAFNPPTTAHLALAAAARPMVDDLVCVIPREFPHKGFDGATLEERIAMLRTLAAVGPRFAVAVSEGGLFIDIARECRAAYRRDPEVVLICGRDAAERITGWDYGRPDAIRAMLDEFRLLVADREGAFRPGPGIEHAVERLPLNGDLARISATEVRKCIETGLPWEHLVPAPIRAAVRRIYSRRLPPGPAGDNGKE